jgi:hypothetical protein
LTPPRDAIAETADDIDRQWTNSELCILTVRKAIMDEIGRRHAIAETARLERNGARLLRIAAASRSAESALCWLEIHLAEIEEFYLEHADHSSGAAREVWLDAAERSLTFYTSELRRLQDYISHPIRH